MVPLKWYLGTILALIIISALAPSAQAQGNDPYVIRGIVYFEGQIAPGVTVEVYYYAQEYTYKAVSDSNGVYAILVSSWIEGESYRITAHYEGQEYEAHNRFIRFEQGGNLREGDQIDIILGEKAHRDHTEIAYVLLLVGILSLLGLWLAYEDYKQQGESKREKQ